MAKVNTVIARTDIYERGLSTKKEKNKKGVSIDRSKPADENDKVIVQKGQTYYWWQFMYGSKQISLIYPKRSQLTQSNYLSQLYDLEDAMQDIQAGCAEDLHDFVDDLKSSLEGMKEECESSLENIPEQLKEGSAGSTLQERIDSLESAIDELDGIDLDDYEEPDDSELKEELQDGDEDAAISDEEIETLKGEKLQEWVDEKISEIQGISLS